MKKKELAARLDRFAELQLASESHSVRIAKDRYDQAERLFSQAETLLRRVDTALNAVEMKSKTAERIEADSIDTAQVREALRFVAMAIGIEETSPGRYVGGYEAILRRVRELLDVDEKAYLLTAFYNAVVDVCRPRQLPGVLMAHADVLTVRRCLQAVADHESTQSELRHRIFAVLRTSRKTAEATEKAAVEAANAATVCGAK